MMTPRYLFIYAMSAYAPLRHAALLLFDSHGCRYVAAITITMPIYAMPHMICRY